MIFKDIYKMFTKKVNKSILNFREINHFSKMKQLILKLNKL